MEAQVKNAADPKQVEKAKSEENRIENRSREDLKAVVSTVNGRRFIWKYLDLCGIYKTTFTGGSETFFLEGKRAVGLTLLKDVIDASPETFIVMQKENQGGIYD